MNKLDEAAADAQRIADIVKKLPPEDAGKVAKYILKLCDIITEYNNNYIAIALNKLRTRGW